MKQMLVSLVGEIRSEDGDDRIDQMIVANYTLEDGKHVLSYEDESQDHSMKVHNTLCFNETEFLLTKKGGLDSQMHFKSGYQHVTKYPTPAGNFIMRTDTETYVCKVEGEVFDVKIAYTLSVNEQYESHNVLLLHAEPKE